jgi:hypothetical protein
MSQMQTYGEPRTRSDAEEAYYDSLSEQVERALIGHAPIPEVPEPSELDFVDGYLIWRGRPVWPSDEPARREGAARVTRLPLPRTDRLRILNERVDTLVRITRERLHTRGAAPGTIAMFDAEQSFYDSLLEQARRAKDGETSAPEVPDDSELRFVDGWLVWRGRPVWWSGSRVSSDPQAHPVDTREPDGTDRSVPHTRKSPRLRRLLTLPWRRAAA